MLPNLRVVCKERITPNAVPYPAVANDPVLQCVKTRTELSPTPLEDTELRIRLQPAAPIALLSAKSFSSIPSISEMNLTYKNVHLLSVLNKTKNSCFYTKYTTKKICSINLRESRSLDVHNNYLDCISAAEILSSLSKAFTKESKSSAAIFRLTAVGRAETK